MPQVFLSDVNMNIKQDSEVRSLNFKNAAASKSYSVKNKRAKSPTKFPRRLSHKFQLCYTELCTLHNTRMIFPIKAHLHKRMLDFNGDRVKLDEWRPILKALSLDQSLHLIAIRSKNSCSKVLEHIDSETKSRSVIKLPVLLTNFIFRRLILSLSRCLSFNSHLKCLELDGLLLSGDYLQNLLTGLEKSSSLQHLSLHRCPLGDEGCRLICSALRNLPNILSVDMSGCNISQEGAYFVAKTLQYQNLNRYGENWKQSLRYRTPDTDIMPGLRRVTLNHNPLIGDSGVGLIVSVLRDDLWLKALDLQNVGLSNSGGMDVLDLLHWNKSLSVLDVHNNLDLDNAVFESIMSMLATNNLGRTSEYHWIREDTLYLPRKPSYQSRDPSFTQRPLKNQETTKVESQALFSNGAVRLTRSSIIPTARKTMVQINKTHSASAVSHNRKSVELKPWGKAIPGHPFGMQKRNVTNSSKISKWDFVQAAGDAGDVSDEHNVRAKVRELSTKLEEETQKRLEAEKQKADLELKLENLTHEREGHILIDENVVKEITEAFAVFNHFVAIFSKRGLPLETAESSELLTSGALSNRMSDSSVSQSWQPNLTSSIEELDEVARLAAPLSSMNIKQKKEMSDEAVASSAGSPRPETAKGTHHPETCEKCDSAEQGLDDSEKAKETQSLVPLSKSAKVSLQSELLKVLNEILQNGTTSELKDVLETDAASNVSSHQNIRSLKLLVQNSASSSASINACESRSKNGSFGFQTGSCESVYANAEQTDSDVNDVEDSNSSWMTESCYSSDPSPTPTLTELNAN